MSNITTLAMEAKVLIESGNYPLVIDKLNAIIEEDKPKKRGRKSKLDLTLEKLGYTRAEMTKFWEDALAVNKKIQMIASCGKDWTDLTEYQLSQLPGLAEKTREAILAKEEEERKEQEAKKKVIDDKKYYEEHLEEILYNKLISNENLSDKELTSIVSEFNTTEWETGEHYKTIQPLTTISELCGHYFQTDWYRDDNYSECNVFNERPFEVKLVTTQTGYDLDKNPTYSKTWKRV